MYAVWLSGVKIFQTPMYEKNLIAILIQKLHAIILQTDNLFQWYNVAVYIDKINQFNMLRFIPQLSQTTREQYTIK